MIDIKEDGTFELFCRKMNKRPYIALDTEFIRERTYFPILALIQVSWKGQDPVLIDPLKIKNWAPFHKILKDPDICKIFHAGRQDLEIFYYQMGEVPENLFDTQIAASMCGYGDQIGYAGLVARILGIQLSKGSSYTNWLQRPLTESQLKYARDDVRYLPAVYEKLQEKAADQKRIEWIREEMQEQFYDALFEPDPNNLWRKVKKAKALKSKDAIVLQEMAVWRDQMARKVNRPVRFIFSDEAMLELSKIEHLTLEHLRTRRGVPSGFVDRYGETILKHHAAGRARPQTEWPSYKDTRERPPSDRSETLADLAWLLIKDIAAKSQIAPNNLISKKVLAYFIEAYCRGENLSSFPISHGWRHEMVGEPLVKLIEGRLVIRVQNRKMIWQEIPE